MNDPLQFYARILYYDSQYHKHLVYYLEDRVGEWVSIKDQPIAVAEKLVMVEKNRGMWPAIQVRKSYIDEYI